MAEPKGTFYVQLEDDILAKRGFITIMKRFAFEKTARKDPWFVLDFCQLGFIGELFYFYKIELTKRTLDDIQILFHLLLVNIAWHGKKC